MGFYLRKKFVLFDANGTLIHRTRPFSYFDQLSELLGVPTRFTASRLNAGALRRLSVGTGSSNT
jgi:hypothetical protein